VFVYDPWVLYQRGVIAASNVVLAGIVGAGKSALTKVLYTRSIHFGRRVYVPGDPKGEHIPAAQAVGGHAIVLGHGMPNRPNSLDSGRRPLGVSDVQWAATVTARGRDLIGALTETVLGRPLSPVEHSAVDVALNAAVAGSQTPILPMVVDRVSTPIQAATHAPNTPQTIKPRTLTWVRGHSDVLRHHMVGMAGFEPAASCSQISSTPLPGVG
jgi:hypothetical protein